MADTVHIYTDGSCRGNGRANNCGGWGAVLIHENNIKGISGRARCTTNQRMEMSAVIEGIKALKVTDIDVNIYTDSSYVFNGFMCGWVKKWREKGWLTQNGTPVANQELWEEIDTLIRQFPSVRFIKVKGHANNKYNNIADALATGRKDAWEGTLDGTTE